MKDEYFDFLDEASAKKIAVMLLATISDFWSYSTAGNTEENAEKIEDVDIWYGIAENWDVSIGSDGKGKITCWLFPVIGLDTGTDHGIEIVLEN